MDANLMLRPQTSQRVESRRIANTENVNQRQESIRVPIFERAFSDCQEGLIQSATSDSTKRYARTTRTAVNLQ